MPPFFSMVARIVFTIRPFFMFVDTHSSVVDLWATEQLTLGFGIIVVRISV
jgi:hypothetical protein